jgi:ribonuclease HII
MTGTRERRQAARMGILLRTERALWATGITRIAGVDEVGVGPLAGPVVAAAVIVPPEMRVRGVDDSKTLRPALREELAERIRAEAAAVSLGVVDVDEIDRINIYQATLEAMRRAVVGLAVVPEHVIVDARTIPGIALPQTPIIKGDSRSYAVAAASIVAKVARDRMMRALHERHPEYGFAAHAGYGTPAHLAALAQHGPCPAHRRSFAPVRQMRLPGISAR